MLQCETSQIFKCITVDVQNLANAYIQSLPSNLQVKIFDQLYDNMFRKIYFLQNKPNKFIDWIQSKIFLTIVLHYFLATTDELYLNLKEVFDYH